MNSLRLSLSSTTIPVTLEDAAGAAQELELVEMSAATRDEYLDLLATRMKSDPTTGAMSVKKYGGIQSELLVRCLRKKEGDAALSVSEIQGWPSSTVSRLFDAAQEINHLKKAELTEKNG